MKTEIIKINPENFDLKVIREVADEIKKGKIVIYPTETSYGLGTNILNEEAIRRIYKVKKRPLESNLTVIVSSIQMAKTYSYLNKKAISLIKRFMPGPLTLVVKKKKIVPDLLNKSFVFRISSNKIANLLVENTNVPIVATSANIHGKPPIYSSKELRQFMGKVDIILDAGNLKRRKPSTIVDITRGKPKLIREGAIPFKKILDALGNSN